MELLSEKYFQNQDVLFLAKDLLGKLIVSEIDNQIASGIIVETEAYKGPDDKASHAYNNRLTNRTKTMFETGGLAYIYLNYGIHHLFNVVTGYEGLPHAVLVRAIEPVDGIDIMLKRRNKSDLSPALTNGPGKWTQALGITTHLNGIKLYNEKSKIRIYDVENDINEIIESPRVGIDYAEEYIRMPWRYRIKGNKWVGK